MARLGTIGGPRSTSTAVLPRSRCACAARGSTKTATRSAASARPAPAGSAVAPTLGATYAPAAQRHPTPRSDTRPHHRKEARLTVSISAAVLLGIFVYLLCRYAGLRFWQAAVCVLFGYLLASSSLGPHIGSWLLATTRFVARLHL